MHSSRVAFSSLQTQHGYFHDCEYTGLERNGKGTARRVIREGMDTFTFAAASPGGERSADIFAAVGGAV